MAHTFVKDVMISDLATLDSFTTIKNAAKIMDEENIGCITITKQNSPDETIWEAAQIMKTKNICKLPIQKDSKVLGIITSDLVNICSADYDSEMRGICDQILSRMESK